MILRILETLYLNIEHIRVLYPLYERKYFRV